MYNVTIIFFLSSQRERSLSSDNDGEAWIVFHKASTYSDYESISRSAIPTSSSDTFAMVETHELKRNVHVDERIATLSCKLNTPAIITVRDDRLIADE